MDVAVKVQSAWIFFAGISDLFLTCMLWFIFDLDGTPSIFRDTSENRTYALLDVISPDQSQRSINSEV